MKKIKITLPNGVVVECSSASDAAVIAASVTGRASRSASRKQAAQNQGGNTTNATVTGNARSSRDHDSANGNGSARIVLSELGRKTIRFMAIQPGKYNSSDIMKQIGITQGKALGPIFTHIKAYFNQHQDVLPKFEDAYKGQKTRKGKVWYNTDRAKDILRLIEGA